MSKRINHATEAKRAMRQVLNACETDENTGALVGIIAAQTHAALALVEQQRIANLIALAKETFATHEAQEALGTFATAKFGEQIGLRPEISAALGIDESTP